MPMHNPDNLKQLQLLKKHINKNTGGTIASIIALAVVVWPYIKPKLDKLDAIDTKVQMHEAVITQTLPAINQHLDNLDRRVDIIAKHVMPPGQAKVDDEMPVVTVPVALDHQN